MAWYSMAVGAQSCCKVTGTHCEGSESRRVAQSPLTATAPDQIHQRKSVGRETGYGEPRTENSRRRPPDMEYTGRQMGSHERHFQQRLPSSTPASSLLSERELWPQPPRSEERREGKECVRTCRTRWEH